MATKNIRISLALDERTNDALTEIATKKALPKSSIIFSIIYQNDEIQAILNRGKKE